MSVTVSMFDPLGLFTTSPNRVYEPSKEKGPPIAIRGSSTDGGVKLRLGENQVHFSGTARGPERKGLPPFEYLEARGMSFSLDADKAPTVDAFGRTDFREKNSRLFTLVTKPGWTGLECARRLAEKVNANDDFRATVEAGPGGSATLRFTRR